jgi:DNA-binding NtrC family response regulator
VKILSRPARVLLVEDDQAVAQLCATMLTFEGFLVARASTVREAVDSLRNAPPDVIIADVRLPDGRFSAIASAIAEISSSYAIPLIAMSGYDAEEECQEAKIAAYLQKPFSLNRMMRVMAAVADAVTSQATAG